MIFPQESFLLQSHNELARSEDPESKACLEGKPIDKASEKVKKSLLKEGASPETISKNLAQLKANKVSQNKNSKLVLGADSVIDLNGEIISFTDVPVGTFKSEGSETFRSHSVRF